MVFKTI